jgi:DNA-binding LacI/PurR family transcriptional regulator
VRRVARQLGYSPNPAAQALRTGRTNAIGVVVRQLRHPFFMAVIEGIDRACRGAGYHMLLGHVHADEGEERAVVELFARGRTDGVLVLGAVPHDEEVIGAALARGLPTVLVDREASAGAPAVTIDYAAGMRLALDHLAGLGHQVIALPEYGEMEARPTARLRLAVAEAYARARGWPAPLRFDAAQAEAGRLGPWLRAAVAATPGLSAVLASDLLAVGLLKAARGAGIEVPGQLSLVALDGTDITTYTTPELTALTPPLAELGATAAGLLLRQVHAPSRGQSGAGAGPGSAPGADSPHAERTLRLPPSLTPRRSTARRPGPLP